MKVLIFLAAWRRPEITEICFMGIDRLRKSGLYPIDTMCVISEKSMIPLCEKYNIDFVIHKNEPLGEKKNVGLNYAMLKSWDYLMEIGSDDVLKTEILEVYRPFFENGAEFFGVKHFMYINSEDGSCRDYKTDTIFGAGRVMKRSMIERVAYGVDVIAKETLIGMGVSMGEGQQGFMPYDMAKENEKLGRVELLGPPRYRLWRDDIMKGLDNSSTNLLHRNFVFHRTVKTEKALGIDIKGMDNIWAFNPKMGVPHDLNEAVEGLSNEEKNALFAMIKQNKANQIERAVI